jgi:hypothetical protein
MYLGTSFGDRRGRGSRFWLGGGRLGRNRNGVQALECANGRSSFILLHANSCSWAAVIVFVEACKTIGISESGTLMDLCQQP